MLSSTFAKHWGRYDTSYDLFCARLGLHRPMIGSKNSRSISLVLGADMLWTLIVLSEREPPSPQSSCFTIYSKRYRNSCSYRFRLQDQDFRINTQPAMSDLSAPRCVTCDAPSTKSCARCKTIYCSKACQVKDWTSHKKACSNLQLELTLTRAAAVIGEAYLTFRKNTWETTIVKIEDTPDALIITDGDNWGGPQGFVKFPGDILPNNKRTQLGVLTVWACYEPFAFMETLMRKSLDGE